MPRRAGVDKLIISYIILFMKDLIEALQIFLRYGNPYLPTHCEHDELFIMVNADHVSDEDKALLAELSFEPNDVGTFSSSRFGSA